MRTATIASGSYRSPSAALSNQAVNLFSDLLVHHMGARLADGMPFGWDDTYGARIGVMPLEVGGVPLGIDCTIVMPKGTPYGKVRNTETLGAKVALVEKDKLGGDCL